MLRDTSWLFYFCFLMVDLDLNPSTCLIPKYRIGSYMTYQTYPKKEGFIQPQHLMIVTLSYRVNSMKIIWYHSCFGYKSKAMIQNYTWNVNATINTYIKNILIVAGGSDGNNIWDSMETISLSNIHSLKKTY